MCFGMKFLLVLVIHLMCLVSLSFGIFRFELGQITNPYVQGWTVEQVRRGDSINLFQVSDIRVNRAGYLLDGPSKYALVFNHSFGTPFELVDARTNRVVYTGTLTHATDFDGNPISEVAQGNLTISFYQITQRMHAGYPMRNNRTGTETVHKADFSNFNEPGRYFVRVGSRQSAEFLIDRYIFNRVASFMSMFLGFQRCGYGSWAKSADCHTEDGSGLGEEFSGRLKGAWHDCGDHVKVPATISFTASMLAFISVVGEGRIMDMFNEDYTDTIITDGIPDHLRETKHGVRFMVNAYNLSVETGLFDPNTNRGAIYTGVLSQHDHQFWDLPSRQAAVPPARGGPPREMIPEDNDSDIMGAWAATLAFFSSQWRVFDPVFADSCLAIAKRLYDLGKHTMGSDWALGFGGHYSSNRLFSDKMGFAALALAHATKEIGDLESAGYYINDLFFNTSLGSISQSDFEWTNTFLRGGWLAARCRASGGATFVSGMATVDWANYWEVVLYGILHLILRNEETVRSFGNTQLLTGFYQNRPYWQEFRNRIANVFAAVIDGGQLASHQIIAHGVPNVRSNIAFPPYNIPEAFYGWGWNRYMAGRMIIPFMFSQFLVENLHEDWTIPYQEYVRYYDWSLRVLNYLLGINPWDISMIVGVGDKWPLHFHNRTSNAENLNTGSFPYNMIPPYGALAPWDNPFAMIEDISERGLAGQGFHFTETCIDFSMATMLAMIMASGDVPRDDVPPIVADVNYQQVDNSTFYISWTTNELTYDTLYWSETNSPSFDNLNRIAIPQRDTSELIGMSRFHELFLTGLEIGRVYYFYIKSTDRFGNVTITANRIRNVDHFYRLELEVLPEVQIENVMVCPLDERTVMISWWTDVPSDSRVRYWRDGTSDTMYVMRDDRATVTHFHQVTLRDLESATLYNFIVSSGATSIGFGFPGVNNSDYQFETMFAFARVQMMGAYRIGTNPEIAVFLDNFDLQYNQSYDGLIFRIYLDYPLERLNREAAAPQYFGHIGVSDATLFDPVTGGVRNVVAEVVNNANIPFRTDEHGRNYAEVRLPRGEATMIRPGGWLYFRMQLWNVNSSDPEFQNSWPIRAHQHPVVQPAIPGLADVSGNEKFNFIPQSFIGLFQEDHNGVEQHIYGYLPHTNMENPDFFQSYRMELSLHEPVISPPIVTHTVESPEAERYVRISGRAISRGENFGYGTISRILINQTEIPIVVPNRGNVEFSYNHRLVDGTNNLSIIALDEQNCAFNSINLTIMSRDGESTPSSLIAFRDQNNTLVPTNVAELDRDIIYFRVNDLDQSRSDAVREDHLFVTIINPAIGDTERVSLRETENHSGAFTSHADGSNIPAAVSLQQGRSFDGFINGRSGDVVMVRYVDPVNSSDVSTAYITLYNNNSGVRFSDNQFLPLSRDFRFAIGRDEIYVRLVDFNNQNRGDLPVTIRSLSTGDEMVINLPKVNDETAVHVYGTGPIAYTTNANSNTSDVLLIGLSDRIVVGYQDPTDPADRSSDTLFISAAYERIFITWSANDTSNVARYDTTMRTIDRSFTLYAIGLKEDGSFEPVNINWNFISHSGAPFRFFTGNRENSSSITVTLTGESEGSGRIEGYFPLDPSVEFVNTGIITIIDPVLRVFLLPASVLDKGFLDISDTLLIFDQYNVYDLPIGISMPVILVGLVEENGGYALHEVGGFWTVLRPGEPTFVPDSLYSGSTPPVIYINALDILGVGKLEASYNAARGLVVNMNVNFYDPVDEVTIHSPVFFTTGGTFLNNNNHRGDTISVDYRLFKNSFFSSFWINRIGGRSDTVSIITNWRVENLRTGIIEDFNNTPEFSLTDTIIVDFRSGDIFNITSTRGDTVYFSFIMRVYDPVQLGFFPNPLPLRMLQGETAPAVLQFVTTTEVHELEAEIFDSRGNLVHTYQPWRRGTAVNGISGDFRLDFSTVNMGSITINNSIFRSLPGSWAGTNLNGNHIQSGTFVVLLQTYDREGRLLNREQMFFYVINKKD